MPLAAASADGTTWHEYPTPLRITIRPHFYETWYFWMLLVGVSSGTVVGGIVWRLRQHQRREEELQQRVNKALGEIDTLHGLLPVCAWCKKVRNDGGYWEQIEVYIRDHSDATISHGICPDCTKKLESEDGA